MKQKGTLRTMKTYSGAKGFVFGLLMGACSGVASCGHAGLKAKIYYLDAAQGGLVRTQENEVIPFDKATGYRCMSPADFDATLTLLRSCLEQNGVSFEH